MPAGAFVEDVNDAFRGEGVMQRPVRGEQTIGTTAADPEQLQPLVGELRVGQEWAVGLGDGFAADGRAE